MAEIFTTLAALTKPSLSKGVTIAWENRNYIKLFMQTKFGKYKNQYIRFSMAGLIKIKIPNSNKYLLVFNRRIENQLQPIGGVYKRHGDESLFNQWNYKADNAKNGLDVDNKSELDLRFMVPGKHCIEVLNWFEKGNEREASPHREFKEEVLDTKILDSEIFGCQNYKHIRRYSKNLSWSDFFSCYEILIYDIFELLPNEAQKLALIELSKQENDLSRGFAIVTCDDIEQLRLMNGPKQIARIGQHTKLLINKDF
ncbi:hypothetical protein [Chryseobacterium sp. KCF3-3]|uniref:SMODS-associated NUDIX domain-containing protein n=1 Tax=Chryseobacterium sp. KCF3-3 TaxID=3231511 RepID=UPI0038B28ED4